MAAKRRHYEAVPKPGPGAHAAVYLRYSSDKQNASTLEKQRRLCGEGIGAEEWVMAREFAEPETTAKSDEIAHRPQFAALLDAAARHEFDVVVVESVDRWGRAESVFWESLKRLDQAEIYWTTVTAPVYNSVSIKQEGFDLAFAISVGMAASYSRTVSRKSAAGMRTQALKGYHHSKFPYGYCRSDPEVDERGRLLRRRMVPDPETFPNLAIIADLRLKGWGSKQIAAQVCISPSLVNHILVNQSYAEFTPGSGLGTVTTKDGDIVQGLHPAAWSQETWARIQQMTAELRGKPRAAAHWHRSYPLGGLMRCSACGRRMIAHTKHANKQNGRKQYRYYDCYDHDRPHCLAPRTNVPCAIAEDIFGTLLAQLAEHADWQHALEQYLDEDQPAPPSNADQRRAIERQMSALDAKLDMGRIDTDAYRRDMRSLQTQLATLPTDAQEKRNAAIAGASRIVDVATGWQHADMEQRQEMATLLIQPLGLVWDHLTQSFLAVRPHEEFAPGFAVALGWESYGGWLTAPGGAWRPQREGESA
jgi:site-specific DNA recombinase